MDVIQSEKTLAILLVFLLTSVLSITDCDNDTISIRKCDVNDLPEADFYVFKDYTNLTFPVYEHAKATKSSVAVLGVSNSTRLCINGCKPYQAFLKRKTSVHQMLDFGKHCNQLFQDDELSAVVCPTQFNKKFLVDGVTLKLNKIGIGISLPFLFVTFIVYALLPEQNLHGKCLMSYVFALFWTFLLTILLHDLFMREVDISIVCKVMGKLTYFFIMSSFFWMNAMSFDIWLTFSGTKGFLIKNRQLDTKRFFKYSGYAWGMPLLFVITNICLTYAASPNAWYNPGDKCWFNGVIPQIMFYYGPLALLITINIILFSITFWKIKQVQKQTAVLKTGKISKKGYQNDNKQKFYLYLKLLFAMGINWAMEIIPWIIHMLGGNVPPAVWYLGEFCNAAFGAFIFFVFVFKKSILNSLKKRYYKMKGRSGAVGSSDTKATIRMSIEV